MLNLNKSAFTLVELIIVVGILAILSAVTIIVINPVEYFKEGRDEKRISSLNSLNDIISAYEYSPIKSKYIGDNNVLYISLPDISSTCSNLELPSLPSGYTYHCVTEDNLHKIDGSGWIPIDFTSINNLGLSVLPIDPNNNIQNNYFIYAKYGNKWELSSWIESEKFGLNGSNDKVSTDGGNNSSMYEIGTNLSIIPQF